MEKRPQDKTYGRRDTDYEARDPRHGSQYGESTFDTRDWQSRNLESISGIFKSHRDLDKVLTELEKRNLRNDVSIMATEETREHYNDKWGELSREMGESRPIKEFRDSSKAPEGATTGGVTGGLLGALIGGLTLAGSVLVPGAGLLVAGPLVGALTGAAVGTAAGGLIGALVGAGIPEKEARFYEKSLQERGNMLVVAHVPKSEEDEVRRLFDRCGAESIRAT